MTFLETFEKNKEKLIPAKGFNIVMIKDGTILKHFDELSDAQEHCKSIEDDYLIISTADI